MSSRRPKSNKKASFAPDVGSTQDDELRLPSLESQPPPPPPPPPMPDFLAKTAQTGESEERMPPINQQRKVNFVLKELPPESLDTNLAQATETFPKIVRFPNANQSSNPREKSALNGKMGTSMEERLPSKKSVSVSNNFLQTMPVTKKERDQIEATAKELPTKPAKPGRAKTIHYFTSIKYQDHCPLMTIKNELDKLDPNDLRKISFNGVQVLSDAALYLFYKYKRHENADKWLHLESVSFDSCPYITDFGVELLAMAMHQPSLVKASECCGCKNLFQYLHIDVSLDGRVNDLFQSPSFTKCSEISEVMPAAFDLSSPMKTIQNMMDMKTYKILILNSNMAEFSVLNYLRQIFTMVTPSDVAPNSYLQQKLTREKVVSDFDRLAINDARLNVTELDTNYPMLLNTPSSHLMIAVEFGKKKQTGKDATAQSLAIEIADKLLQSCLEGVYFLQIMVLIVREMPQVQVKIEDVKAGIFAHFNEIKTSLENEELRFFDDLDCRQFQEQEQFRDKIRLLFTIKKLTEGNFFTKNIVFQYLDKSELIDENVSKTSKNANNLLNNLTSSFTRRYENIHMHRLGKLLAQRRYHRRILRLEDFIDDVYQFDDKSSTAKSSFKLLIQTDPAYTNLIEDFLQYKRHLGEIIYTKLYNSDQWVIITDITWFFIVVNRILVEMDKCVSELRSKVSTKETSPLNYGTDKKVLEMEYDENKNIYYAKLMKTIKSPDFWDEFVIQNQQQAEMLMNLLRQFDILSRIENQTDNLIMLPEYLSPSLSKPDDSVYDYDSNLERLWPSDASGSLEITMALKFYFKLPKSVFVRLQSSYLDFLQLSKMGKDFMICHEGCVNILLHHWVEKRKIILSVRTANMESLLEKRAEASRVAKRILALFMEYSLILEGILFDLKIPYSYSSKPIKGLQFFQKIHTNIIQEDEFINLLLEDPGSLLACEHSFKNADKFDANTNYMRCQLCDVNSTWFKSVYNSYRKMNPMFKCEQNWTLRVEMAGLVNEGIEPDRKAQNAIFTVENESVSLLGTEAMSPCNFSSFDCVIINSSDSIRVGVTILNTASMVRQTLTMSTKTRRITNSVEQVEMVVRNKKTFYKNNGKSENEVYDIRSQRYTKQFGNPGITRLPRGINTEELKPQDQDLRSKLMQEIVNYSSNRGGVNKYARPEVWPVANGDRLSVRIASVLEAWEISFYYNNERVGFQLVGDAEEYEIYPYIETHNSTCKFATDISFSKYRSTFSRHANLKKGMVYEFEDENLLVAASIVQINRETKMIQLRLENQEPTFFWIDPLSPSLHPCGFSEYMRTEKPESLTEGLNLVDVVWTIAKTKHDWSAFFKKETSKCPAPFELFTDEQKGGMSDKYFPAANSEYYLSCEHKLNARFVWSALKLMTNENLAKIYRGTGIISSPLVSSGGINNNEDDPLAAKNDDRLLRSALVLLPNNFESMFSFNNYPNVCHSFCLSNLNISCIHREEIKLFVGLNNFMSYTYPHLLVGQPLDLEKSLARLSPLYLYVIMCTCLDLSSSTNNPLYPNYQLSNLKRINDSKQLGDLMRTYFRQLACRLSLELSLFSDVRFLLCKTDKLEKLIIDECVRSFEEDATESVKTTTKQKLDKYLDFKISEFDINSTGLCKYCNKFNLDLASASEKSQDLQRLLYDLVKSNEEYCKIITSLIINDKSITILGTGADKQKSVSSSSGGFKSIRITRHLLSNFPNLKNLCVKNVRIERIEGDAFIECPMLMNLEFVHNDLREIPADMFKAKLTQFVIENNPIAALTDSLFLCESLRSLMLNKLCITQLPDGWFSRRITDTDEVVNIRSINIYNTKLASLPNDLLTNNVFLEQLIFQGVTLLLPPDNESQWSFMSVDLPKIVKTYCPILLSVAEATSIFKKFDYDSNGFLDFKELQHFNAFIFKYFPRLGDKKPAKKSQSSEEEEDESVSQEEEKYKLYGDLPELLFTCTNLNHLDFSFQAIKIIPDQIKALKFLKVLKLKYCVYLETLSPYVGQLKLVELELTGCISLKTPPLEIQKRGVTCVLAYLNRLLSGSVECKRTKLMLQGLGGAGKTSLVQALIHNMYQNNPKQIPMVTDGISISDWTYKLDKKSRFYARKQRHQQQHRKIFKDEGHGAEDAESKEVEASPQQEPTLVVEEQDEYLTFSVFDFAGQTVYYNTNQFFLTNRSIYLLVWNVRLGAEHSGLEFWLNSIDCHTPSCPIFIIGTHIDQVNKYELPIERLRKRYPQIVGFHFVSCFDGKGVGELSKAIVNTALRQKYMGEKIPKCWLDFEAHLKQLGKAQAIESSADVVLSTREHKKAQNLIEYEEVEKIGLNFGIFDKTELAQTIQFMHDLGSLMHFNNEFLKSKIVINPQWLIDLLACLVSVNNNHIVDGKLFYKDVSKIWHKYDIGLHSWILKLTEKFDLTFQVQNQSMNLVPCLMSETPPSFLDEFWLRKVLKMKNSSSPEQASFDDAPMDDLDEDLNEDDDEDEDWDDDFTENVTEKNKKAVEKTAKKMKKCKETKIIYTFEYLPAGLFNRSQVRMYQMTNNKIIWKNGSLLKKNKHYALITRRENQIEVRVKGVQPQNLIYLIHEVMELLIAESFSGVSYDYSFPCPDCYQQSSIEQSESMFAASLVRRASQMRTVFLQCRNRFHVTPLVDLQSLMPPDTLDNYDQHIRHSLRDLEHLKTKLTFDLLLINAPKDLEDETILKPDVIKQDLEKAGYSCWYNESLSVNKKKSNEVTLDSVALILRNVKLVLFCVSDRFALDSNCLQIFSYATQTMNKPYILISLGNSLQWMNTSQLGAHVANEFFIKINTIERYASCGPRLIELVKKRMTIINLQSSASGRKNIKKQCFLSYCHSNSHDAIANGAPLKNDTCLGWCDPRSLKSFLENEGYTVWLDTEMVGNKGTLFEDLAEGIRNSQVVVACVSNEYAASENCMKEFRFASNLKKPIILCTFGSSRVTASDWRKTELGIMSCLYSKEINFQLENPNAFSDLLQEIKTGFKIEPLNKNSNFKELRLDQRQADESPAGNFKAVKASQPASAAYNETYELARRKFLRQIANFSDTASSQPFPRLFVLDLSEELDAVAINSSPYISSYTSPASQTQSRRRNQDSSSLTPSTRSERNVKTCIRIMCEHEEGWHPCGPPIEYETITNIPRDHYAYLVRIMNLIKHGNSDRMSLSILNGLNSSKLEEIISVIDQSLTKIEGNDDQNGNAENDNELESIAETRKKKSVNRPLKPNYTTDLKKSYDLIKAYIIKRLSNTYSAFSALSNQNTPSSQPFPPSSSKPEASGSEPAAEINNAEEETSPSQLASKFKSKLMENLHSIASTRQTFQNANMSSLLGLLGLNRCLVPSGKILWLCPKHSQDENVQILKNDEPVANIQFQNDEFNSILFEELKRYTASPILEKSEENSTLNLK